MSIPLQFLNFHFQAQNHFVGRQSIGCDANLQQAIGYIRGFSRVQVILYFKNFLEIFFRLSSFFDSGVHVPKKSRNTKF